MRIRPNAQQFLLIASLFSAVALANAVPAGSYDQTGSPEGYRNQRSRRKLPSPSRVMGSYRSPGGSHKLVIPADEPELYNRVQSSGSILRSTRYGTYSLVEISETGVASLDASSLERLQFRDDLNLILLKAGPLDTTAPTRAVPEELRQPDNLSNSLHMVQLFGPPGSRAVDSLRATGAQVVAYIPNNTYLIWTTRTQLERVQSLRRQSDVVQWIGPFHPAFKLDPRIRLASAEVLPISIQILKTPRSAEVVNQIKALSRELLMPEFTASGSVQLRIMVESNRLAEVARMPEVLVVEPWPQPKLSDERANQIVAGALSEETINNVRVGRPNSPGFYSFLLSHGFGSNFDFAIDIGDTGFDIGFPHPPEVHPDFLDANGQSRIAYLFDFTSDYLFHSGDRFIHAVHDSYGHGTINASIAAGFNLRTESAFRDAQGFQYGLGVAPFARIGVSKLFGDDGSFQRSTSFVQMLTAAYRGGARVTSNSWGICDLLFGFCNLYSLDSAIYDWLVRDADPETPGNQGMVTVFSAGNDGTELPATINIPATGKNVITVGASEGFLSVGPDGAGLLDGCGVGPTHADNALDIIAFSAGGYVQDGRAKPDLVAPGTHITGAASQDLFFIEKPEADVAVCDKYFPPGQTLYSWSSGTSHSTPLVAGGAALAIDWLTRNFGAEPSPALVKALLLNSTTYMTGRFGGDSLPGRRQGWGLLNLSRMFEPADRIVLDESPSRLLTESGGDPFTITGVITDPSKEFRVMLVWTDPPGIPFSNAPYVNQLNLEVTVNGVVYKGNNFSGQYSAPGGQNDFLNNVQGVRLPPGQTGSFVIRIFPTVIAFDGVPGNDTQLDQDFALIVSNAVERAVPILGLKEVDGFPDGVIVTHPSGSADQSLIPGELASISIQIHNLSQTENAVINSATLTDGETFSSVSEYPVIGPNEIKASLSPFSVRLPASVKCGTTAVLQLRLETEFGRVTLPVRIQVGRAAGELVLLDDDVDSRRFKWKLKKGFSLVTDVGRSGSASYHAVDSGIDDEPHQALALLKKKIQIPENAGRVRLSFFHIFDFEPGFDGGVMEISVDGGATWEDLGSRVIVGGYDGHVTEASENPLGNRFAWTSRGRPGVFSPVVINLDDFAGKRIRLRFLAGFDLNTGLAEGYTGWFIDDLKITASEFTCR